MHSAAVSLLVAAALVAVAAHAQTCPPAGFDSMRGFNLSTYISARWYIQEQMPINYLPVEWNYCVTAMYTQLEPQLVKVENYANIGQVNGEPTGGELRAELPSLSDPSKLRVGPEFVPRQFWGPYWIIDAGPSPLQYDWAIIAGGPPTISTGNGCKTGDGVNNSGFWIFTREPVPDPALVEAAKSIAKSKGFDTTVLNKVEHRGCTYNSTVRADNILPKWRSTLNL